MCAFRYAPKQNGGRRVLRQNANFFVSGRRALYDSSIFLPRTNKKLYLIRFFLKSIFDPEKCEKPVLEKSQ